MAEHTTGRQAHRFWQRTLIPQAAAIAAVAAVVAWLAQNTVFNLAERGAF